MPKSKWMDSLFKAILPDRVYAWSQSKTNQDRMKLSRWFAKQGISIMEGDGFTHVLFNDAVIGEWRYRLENRKVEQTGRMLSPQSAEGLKQTFELGS